MTNKRGTVKLFTFSFEIDAPNIISCAPKIFSFAPKNLHLVAQVLPNSNLNFEPSHWCDFLSKHYKSFLKAVRFPDRPNFLYSD